MVDFLKFRSELHKNAFFLTFQELFLANIPDEDIDADDETDEGSFPATLLKYDIFGCEP